MASNEDEATSNAGIIPHPLKEPLRIVIPGALDITLPDMIFNMDEVGGNISQKGNGEVGDQLLLCEKVKTSQQK